MKWVLLLLVCAVFAGCTEAELEEIPQPELRRDDKLQVEGQLCTQSPETLAFPLRVMFVVDSSVSMEVTDPPDPVTMQTGRERAVTEVWTDLLDQGPEGVRVSIIRFSSQAQPQTPIDDDGDGEVESYFTADREILAGATASLAVTDRTTNYNNALSEAYAELRTEMSQADQESLPLSRYVVIFLSDGVPDTGADQRNNTEDNILESVQALVELADNFRVGEFALHTAYLSGGQGVGFDQSAQDLLRKMAEVGSGNFRSFPGGESLNFLFVDFSILKRLFTLKSLVAVNTNLLMDTRQHPGQQGPAELVTGPVEEGEDAEAGEVVEPVEVVAPDLRTFVDLNLNGEVECGEPLVDSDADGLSDMMEFSLGTDALVADTDDDGLRDGLEWQFAASGLRLRESDGTCFVASPCLDVDEDGDCDCLLDLDSDGICDCQDDPDLVCANAEGLDCLDQDEDGFCDCPDLNGDGRCDYRDRDGDGVGDCEEVFYGTSQRGVDSDADGIPDPVELRAGTNPTQDDALDDEDFDRTLNGVEVLAGTDPLCEDAALRSRVAYRYTLEDVGIRDARSCYDFSISNITLVPTLQPVRPTFEDAVWPGHGWNRILVFAGEVAFDDPRAFARYRVACVMASYNVEGDRKDPPSGRVLLEEEDFIEVADFDPLLHCPLP